MKRTMRFFLSSLLTAIIFIITSVQTLAVDSDTSVASDFEAMMQNWGAGVIVILVIALIVVITLILRAAGYKKSLPLPPESPEPDFSLNKKEEDKTTDSAEESVPEIQPEPVAATQNTATDVPTSEPTPTPTPEPVPDKKPIQKKKKADEPKNITKTPVGEQIHLVEDENHEPKCEFKELSADYTVEKEELPEQAVDAETGAIYTFDENGIPVPPEDKVIRFKWSFLGRLSQAHDEVKYHYLTLRRVLLAYNKMRSNISWNFDTYIIGRRTVAKLKIRGKNLVVYFPIDPAKMEGTKYLGEDVSSVSRYKTVPFAYAINGSRKLHYAIELIEMLMEGRSENAPEPVDEKSVDTYIPEKDFNTLYNRKLIRIGGFLSVGSHAAHTEEDDE